MTHSYPYKELPSLDARMAAQLREVLAEEYDVLVNNYLEEFPGSIQRLRGAISSHNTTDIFNISHMLKSSSGSFGMTRLFTLLQHLELQARSNKIKDAESQAVEIEKEFNNVYAAMASTC